MSQLTFSEGQPPFLEKVKQNTYVTEGCCNKTTKTCKMLVIIVDAQQMLIQSFAPLNTSLSSPTLFILLIHQWNVYYGSHSVQSPGETITRNKTVLSPEKNILAHCFSTLATPQNQQKN